MVVFHNMEGHRSFLLGHYSTDGLKLYFPAAMLLKWPLIVLLSGIAGAYVVLRRKVPGSRDLLLMSLVPAVYFGFAVIAHINIGVRHVLPIYPFLLLYAGAFAEWARTWHCERALDQVFLRSFVDRAGGRYCPVCT